MTVYIPTIIHVVLTLIAQFDSSPIELIRLIGSGASTLCYLIEADPYWFCQLIHLLHYLPDRKK